MHLSTKWFRSEIAFPIWKGWRFLLVVVRHAQALDQLAIGAGGEYEAVAHTNLTSAGRQQLRIADTSLLSASLACSIGVCISPGRSRYLRTQIHFLENGNDSLIAELR